MASFPRSDCSPKFVCRIVTFFNNLCAESSKVCVRNHQDNYFLINVACKSNANMIKWPHAAIFANFKL